MHQIQNSYMQTFLLLLANSYTKPSNSMLGVAGKGTCDQLDSSFEISNPSYKSLFYLVIRTLARM